MNKAFIYYYSKALKNKVKKRPIKAFLSIVFGIYFMLIPFFFKELIINFNLDNPKGYIIVFTVISIYLGMPMLLTYFKRKGLIFKESDINFIFTSPISPKNIIVFGMIKNIFLYIAQYIAFYIAMVFIFNISFQKALIVSISGLIFTNTIDISLAIIMYGSEKISNKTKNIIRMIIYVVLLSIAALLGFNLLGQGLNFKTIFRFLSSNLFMIIPIFGWELGFVKLVLLGPNIYNIIASFLYIFSAFILLYFTIKMKCTGEFFEDALSYSQEYEKALQKSKDGGIGIIGKKTKVSKIRFSSKGKYAKAIFFKQIDEYKKISLINRFGKFGIFLIISTIAGIILKYEGNINANSIQNSSSIGTAYIVASYFAIFFSKANTWKKEFDTHFIYLIPDTTKNKILYSTLFQCIKYLAEGLVISAPIIIIIELPIYLIPLAALVYGMTNIMILYTDLILREILTGKIGDTASMFVMMFIDLLVILLGGGIILLMNLSTTNILIITGVLIIYLLIMSFIGLTLSSKLYSNMEFVNN